MKYLIPLLLSLAPGLSFSHGDEDHSKPVKKEVDKIKKDAHGDHSQGHGVTKVKFNNRTLSLVNENYLKMVKPIFANKCFSCHSSSEPLPWYSKVPIVGDIVKGDRKEG